MDLPCLNSSTTMHQHIDFISLGCAKNLVDSERLMYQLHKKGYVVHHDPETPSSPIVIINTCGFISDAKQESIDTILNFAQAKTEGMVKHLYVMGCLSQRYREELKKEIPEVDAFYGKFDFLDLADRIGAEEESKTAELMPHVSSPTYRRWLTTPSHYAYVKIAEGCNKRCAYCIIPHITGPQHSRSETDIIQEVQWLVSKGVKEFQIIAQDLTSYGTDTTGGCRLPMLIDKIAGIPGVEWIRLHYAYPNHFPWQLLQVMQQHDNICKYLDVALQHVATPVLKAMHRNITREETYEFVAKVRKECPGIQLRTTLMVGFPGETEEDFRQLLQFVSDMSFERMGAFAYSEEEGTYSATHYTDDIPQEVKEQRLQQLMQRQQDISDDIMHQEVGKIHKVIIDRQEGEYYVARNQFSSPEVDPEILIPSNDNPLTIGEFYNVRILQATPFDLYAELT